MFQFKKILWGLLSILGILLAMELYIRGSEAVTPSLTDFDEEVGRVRRRNLEFVMFGEGFTINKFNEGRYLGPYYEPQKNETALRIALLGDSYVEGFQVFDRHHFRRRIENLISKSTGNPTEVLNFGRSGFDLEDIVAYNYLEIQKYNPDYTLFFLKNDDFVSRISDPLVPNIVFTDDSIYTRIFSSEQSKREYIRYKDIPYYSSYLNMMNICFKQHKRGLTNSKLFGKFYHPTLNSTQRNESADRVVLVKSQIQRIDSLIEFSTEICNLIIVKSDTSELPKGIINIINNKDVRFIDLSNILDSKHINGMDPYFWNVTNQYGHWNHMAHAKIGEALANEIYSITESD